MLYVFHDSYKTKSQAKKVANDMINIGLVNGVKLTKKGSKSRPFMLYILPLRIEGGKKS
jgi:hypothetical protein